jgi:antitoxin VapB
VRPPSFGGLPDDLKRIHVVAIGRMPIRRGARELWDSWFDGDRVSQDFMSTRDQPGDQEREGV